MSVLPGAPVEMARLCPGRSDTPADLTVTDLSLDSRTVERDGLFLACSGRRTHGLATLETALARGVRAEVELKHDARDGAAHATN